MVSAVTGFAVQYNKAIVGKQCLCPRERHPPGRHAEKRRAPTRSCVRKHRRALDTWSWASIPAVTPSATKLIELGFELGDNALEGCLRRFKDLADRRRTSTTRTSMALVDDEINILGESTKVIALTVIAGTGGPQKAILTMDVDGQHVTKEATGDGPVDATFNAIKAISPHEATLSLYQVHAVTEGTDAQAEVSVRLEADGRIATGKGADTDTLVASARAYVSAMNKLAQRRQASNPGALQAVDRI
jgi:2-isopropylmalate synthase